LNIPPHEGVVLLEGGPLELKVTMLMWP